LRGRDQDVRVLMRLCVHGLASVAVLRVYISNQMRRNPKPCPRSRDRGLIASATASWLSVKHDAVSMAPPTVVLSRGDVEDDACLILVHVPTVSDCGLIAARLPSSFAMLILRVSTASAVALLRRLQQVPARRYPDGIHGLLALVLFGSAARCPESIPLL
jgi:hypothetical protein